MATPARRCSLSRRLYKYIAVLLLVALVKFQSVIRDILAATRGRGAKLRDHAAKRVARLVAPSPAATTTTQQSKGDWVPPVVEERQVTRDGVQLVYRIAHRGTRSSGDAVDPTAVSAKKKERATKVLLYCCPLGWSGFDALDPLVAALPEYEFVCWDYRGFFKSDLPESERLMSIHEHARDGAVVLRDFLGLDADAKELPEGVKVVVAGHSMGVQVGFEFALLYPKLVSAMLMYNGAHGHVFSTAYQAVVPCFGFHIPFISSTAPMIASAFARSPWVLPMLYDNLYSQNRVTKFFMGLYGRSPMGSPMLRRMKGDNYLYDVFDNYLSCVVSNLKTCRSYARSFQELDMHSVKHVMGEITHPTLLVSGFWDSLTPCSHMFEMARWMPNARHKCDRWSTHATMVEHPEFAVEHSVAFLADHGLLATGELDNEGTGETCVVADSGDNVVTTRDGPTELSSSTTPSWLKKEGECSQDSESGVETDDDARSAESWREEEDPLQPPTKSEKSASGSRWNRGRPDHKDDECSVGDSVSSSSSTCSGDDGDDVLRSSEMEPTRVSVV